MAYRTLTELESDVRFQFDLEGFSARHTQAQIFRLLNESIRRMRQMVTGFGSAAYLAVAAGTTSAGATSGRQGTILSLTGGASIDMVREVFAQNSQGEWFALDQIPSQYECADGAKATDTGEPQGWVLAEYDREQSSGSDTSQSRQILIVPPSDGTYNFRVRFLPTWTDATSTTRIMSDSGNLDWVLWDVGVRLAERDEDMVALRRRMPKLAELEQQMRTRCSREGSPVRSRVAAQKAKARRW